MSKRGLEVVYKGHKHACRKPGQVVVGDDMVLYLKDDDGEIRPAFVKVIACVDATTNVWHVYRSDSSDRYHEVHGDILHRIRPPPFDSV